MKGVAVWVNFKSILKALNNKQLTEAECICVSELTIIGSDNGLSPGRHQAIIWTSAGVLSIWPLETNFNEILIEIHIFSFKKTEYLVWKMAAIFLGLNV